MFSITMENQVNVFDISRNLSWPLLRLCYCLHYDVTKVISDRGCELSKYGVPNIFPEFLIRLTFELNISKKTEPK